mgnify:CR=1 FL=1
MKYFAIYIPLICAIVGSAYLFNAAIDPYDKYRWNPLGLEKAVTESRELKFRHIDAQRDRYEFFFVGSSRVQRLDPALAEELTGLRGYNYGVENALPEDLLAIARHLLAAQKPKEVFLLLDFYLLNGYIGIDKRLLQSHLRTYLDPAALTDTRRNFLGIERMYFSLEALDDSFTVLWNNWRGIVKKAYEENGRHVAETPPEFPRLAKQYFTSQYVDYRIDRTRIGNLSELRRILEAAGVKLTVAISPMNAEHLAAVLADPELRTQFIIFKREVVNIFREVRDFNNSGVERYDGNPWWFDSVHPSEPLTAIMLKSALGRETPADPRFGMVVTPDNIEDYLRAEFGERP